MDTMEGGTLVEDNRPSGVGKRQGSQPRMRGATQTLLPFSGVVQPLERPNFTGLGVSQPRNDLSIKVWKQYDLFRGKKGNMEGVWSKCKWCNNISSTNITRLTQHFTYDFSLKNLSMLELPAYRRRGLTSTFKDVVPCLRSLNFRYDNWMQGNEARPFFLQHKKKLVVLRESRSMKKRQWHKLGGRSKRARRTNWNKVGQMRRNQFDTRSSR
ncbi:hypothetical protein R1flu_016951 [Riccia fluitans]|uniref:BED-type domain-containing protein n=1 Tax=Riccia fluitans TaxID=41844 RepID=A0ABD1YNN8_9MARC